jgi:autotransporter-associated beta strand protein
MAITLGIDAKILLLSVAVLCATALRGSGAVRVWSGEGATPVWSNRTNWADRIVPANGDSVVFSGSRHNDRTITNNLTALRLESLVFSNRIDGLVLRGEPIGISNQVIHATSGSNLANLHLLLSAGARATSTNGGTLGLGGDLTLSGRTTMDADSGITISGRVSGSGDLVKNGSGTLIFAGAATNTFDGTLVVRDGVARLARSPGGQAAGAIRVDAAALVVTRSDQWPASAILTVQNGGRVTFDETSQTNTLRDLELNGSTLEGRNFLLRIRRSLIASSTTSGPPARIVALNLGATLEPVGEVGVNVTAGELETTLGIAGGADATFIKRGPGRFTVGRTVAPTQTARFGGLFRVNAGVLQIDGETDASVNVTQGGELTGTGEVHSVSVTEGGTFRSSPPAAGASSFRIAGAFELATGARFVAAFRNLAPQQFVPLQVVVDGRFSANGAALEIDSIGFADLADNTRLNVIRSAIDGDPGTFDGVASGATLIIGNRVFSAAYTNGGFNVTALPGANHPPDVGSLPDINVPEGVAVDFILGHSDPDGFETVTLTLVEAPAGATLIGGNFRWLPGEADGPGRFRVTIRATDNGTPTLSDEGTFEIVVDEMNRLPVFAPIPDQITRTGERLEVTLSATDTDLPPQALFFSVESGPGVIVSNNVYRWSVPSTFENTTNAVTLRAHDGITNVARSFRIVVPTNAPPAPNRPPVFDPIPDRTVRLGETLEVTLSGSDPDAPPQMTFFRLDRPPEGMVLDGAVIRWTPTQANTNGVTIRAFLQDNGNPIEEVERSFRIFVLPAGTAPVLSIAPHENDSLRIEWPLADASFQLERTSALDVLAWIAETRSRVTNGSSLRVIVPTGSGSRFFRLARPAAGN